MPKKRSILNNSLGGDQIVYTNTDQNIKKDTIDTYNVSATNIEVDKLVNKVYNEFNDSKERQLMIDGIKYFDNESAIDQKERFDYAGTESGKNNKLHNAKLHKNFMRKLTRQKVTYLLGKPFSITTDKDDYKKLLEDRYFTKPFYRLVFNLLKESIKEGINWINPYYNESGELCFRRVPGNQVKPFWADREHTKLDQLIHYYDIEVYKGDEKKTVTYADYYSHKGVIHYIKEDKGFTRDSERPREEGNFILYKPATEEIKDDNGNIVETTYKLDENGNIVFEPQEMVWDILPWVPLKYNEEEKSLLKYIKSYQDEYEALISAMVDIIIDIPDVIKVFKGYGGTDLKDLMDNISKYRAVIVDPDGDVSSLETKYDGANTNSLLDRLRKDAYEDGAGADMQNDNTGDKSGVGLKFLYSDLDLDSEELEQELRVFFEWLLFFIDFDINLKDHKDYNEEEVTFNFNRTLIINENEVIENINNSRDMIPDEILLPKHPYVEDLEEVQKAIEKEEQEEQKRLEEEMKQFGNQAINAANNVQNNQSNINNQGNQNAVNNGNKAQ